MEQITLIEKESISECNFVKEDVLSNESLRQLRYEQLEKAERLGNNYKRKVRITFKTEENEILNVETTIWAVGKDYIELKAGIMIPIGAILDIKFD
ncbi:MAG: hypothetical protein FVQ77_17320 [Cytophagales bacterium]|nr:hypothetical protein [Cytophagales bacterium]